MKRRSCFTKQGWNTTSSYLDQNNKTHEDQKWMEHEHEFFKKAPNNTAYTRWSCHSGLANPVQIVSTSPAPSNGCPISVFWTSRPCGPAGWMAMLLIKAGDVETNTGPTTTCKQVWICDICHRQIQVRKQISIRCNRIEQWVHLRCAGISLAQYPDTWTFHLHRKSRLTTHTYITPFSQTLVQAAHPFSPNTTHTHTTATKTQTHIQLSPNPILSPTHPNTSHPAPSQTHTHGIHSTYTSHYTYL